MNVRSTLAVILASAAIGFIADSAMALPMQSRDKVEGTCNEKGGTFFAPNDLGFFGCVYKDGSGISCGGQDSVDPPRRYHDTCDTFRRMPGRHDLPTRRVIDAEKSKKAVDKKAVEK